MIICKRKLFLLFSSFMYLNFGFGLIAFNGNKSEFGHKELISESIKSDSGQDELSFLDITFEQWQDRCLKLPTPDKVEDHYFENKALTRKEFVSVIEYCLYVLSQEKCSLADKKNWISNSDELEKSLKQMDKNLENKDSVKDRFIVQKIDDEMAEIYVHADIHGDIHSFMKFLGSLYRAKNGQGKVFDNNFKILDPKCRIILLGDYSDRCCYGAEVLATVALFKAANPENFIALRGNHEDVKMNMKGGLLGFDAENERGHQERFLGELLVKFGQYDKDGVCKNKDSLYNLLRDFYNFLPVALFMGFSSGQELESPRKDYILFCHGGLEFGFDPSLLLSNSAKCLYQEIDKLDTSWLGNSPRFKVESSKFKEKNNKIDSEGLSYLWGDFCIKKNGKAKHGDRGKVFSLDLTGSYMSACSSIKDGYFLRYIVKAHQHNGEVLDRMLENGGYFNFWADKTEPIVSSFNSDMKSFNLNKKIEKFDGKLPVWILNASPGYNYALNKKEENKIARSEADFLESYMNRANKSYDGNSDYNGNGEMDDSFYEPISKSKINKLLDSADRQDLLLSYPKYNYDTFARLCVLAGGFKDLKAEFCRLKVY